MVSLTSRPLYFPPPNPFPFYPQKWSIIVFIPATIPDGPNPHTATLFLLSAAWVQSTQCHTVPTSSHINTIHIIPHPIHTTPNVPLICFYVRSNVRTSLQKSHLQPFHRALSTSLLSQEMTTKPNTNFAIHWSFSLAATPSIWNIARKSCIISLTAK